ncbi:heterokaryon incompatibility protein-domain-containing protein [Tricladium varicosporioides]|nr:heterokaryon incompatibility protein-domain-containing protein [Hymenoscyphus varicosporioides]
MEDLTPPRPTEAGFSSKDTENDEAPFKFQVGQTTIDCKLCRSCTELISKDLKLKQLILETNKDDSREPIRHRQNHDEPPILVTKLDGNHEVLLGSSNIVERDRFGKKRDHTYIGVCCMCTAFGHRDPDVRSPYPFIGNREGRYRWTLYCLENSPKEPLDLRVTQELHKPLEIPLQLRLECIVLNLGLEVASVNPICFEPCKVAVSDYKALDQNSLGRLSAVKHPRSKSKAFEIAHAWLEECDDTHNCTKNTKEDLWIPKRLLDLGNHQAPDYVQLRMGSDIEIGSKYATLSHCWGGHNPDSLGHATEEELMRGRKTTKFCRLFQDVFELARYLGLRYLWIDSLCIFQGPDGDFNTQASQMWKIYHRSHINIAASSAASGEEALFDEQSTDVPLEMKMKLEDLDLSFRQPVNLETEREIFLSQPLVKRAWVLQELFLSPRVIYFSSSQLFWSCQMERKSESHPSGIEHVKGLRNLSWMYGTRFKTLYEEDNKESSSSTHDDRNHGTNNQNINKAEVGSNSAWDYTWDTILSDFSETELTYPSDRLIAFSGVAQEVYNDYLQHSVSHFQTEEQSGLQPDYLAGLWRQRMPWDLFWYPEAQTASRPKSTYFAPTWSWASINGPFSPPPAKVRSDDYIVEFQVTITPLIPRDYFSPLSAASLTIKAPTSSARIDWYLDSQGYPTQHYDTMGAVLPSGLKIDPLDGGHIYADEPVKWSSLGGDGLCRGGGTSDLVLLLMAKKHADQPCKGSWEGLILRPAGGGTENFVRWGWWTMPNHFVKRSWSDCLGLVENIKWLDWTEHFAWNTVTIV